MGLTVIGCCVGDIIVWCMDGELVTSDCGDEGCGWSTADDFYACGSSGADPSATWPRVCAPEAVIGGVDDLHYGDIVVSEILAHPSRVPDASGDDSGQGFTVDFDTVLRPGERAVFASRHADENGGVEDPVLVWAGSGFELTDAGDSIRLVWDGLLIDEVAWSTETGWSISVGRSLVLAASAYEADLNDMASRWCQASTPYGLGDYGTPGAADPSCP